MSDENNIKTNWKKAAVSTVLWAAAGTVGGAVIGGMSHGAVLSGAEDGAIAGTVGSLASLFDSGWVSPRSGALCWLAIAATQHVTQAAFGGMSDPVSYLAAGPIVLKKYLGLAPRAYTPR